MRKRHLHLWLATMMLPLLVAGCLGQDWKSNPLELDYEHHRSTIQIETDEEFVLQLRANGLHPQALWELRTIDTAIVESTEQIDFTEVRAPGDWQAPAPGDEQESDGTDKPLVYIPSTHFWFIGRAEGTSQLMFDLQADGELIDMYELTVAVVDDACDIDKESTGIIAAMRCTDGPPMPEPAGLVYDSYGSAVRLEPGDEFTVELRASGLHPDMPWEVTDINTAVVDLQASVHDTDVLASPEHTRWPPTVFPETRLRFIGRALGTSPLTLQLSSGDDQLDVFEATVFVVADACDIAPEQAFHTFTPHICFYSDAEPQG